MAQFITTKGVLGLPWEICTLICIGVATLYYFIWPKGETFNYAHYFILRYGHTLVWVLLALSCVIASTEKLGGMKLASYTAKASLAIYILFLLSVGLRSLVK